MGALVLAAYTAFILFQAWQPPSGTQSIVGLDKALHAGAFAMMFALAWWTAGRRWLLGCAAFAFGLGVLVEVGQAAMPFGREASLADVLANSAGILMAFVVCRALTRRSQ
ncbi:MAG: VanZ family protein [Pseudomonadota bacterium]